MIVGYTTGVFDMFHIGHLRLLERAKDNCDYLVVGVSTDKLVSSAKKVKLVIPYEDRAAIIAALRCVDKVVPQETYEKFDAWHQYKFNKMFVGSDWKGTPKWNHYEDEFSKIGVEIVYFDYTIDISSTMLRDFVENNYESLRAP